MALYYQLSAKNPNTIEGRRHHNLIKVRLEGRRHHNLIKVRLLKAANSLQAQHPDRDFCFQMHIMSQVYIIVQSYPAKCTVVGKHRLPCT